MTTTNVAARAALLMMFLQAAAEPAQAGEEHEISRAYKSSQHSSTGSSGSSNGRYVLVERVVSASASGLELEYDLPKNTTAQDRARQWQFPARVFRPVSGAMRLLNEHELETRVDDWLKTAGWTRAMCGRWVFTWNAFRIECDPQSVLKTISTYDLRAVDLREGALYQDPEARTPAVLTKRTAQADGVTYVAVAEVDSDVVRRARAESDVAVGEVMREPVTIDAALREHAKDSVSGTISITFHADREGEVLRRTRMTKLETKKPDGSSESASMTETVERHPVHKSPAHD